MIPGTFVYHRPKTVPEAVALLADLEDARPLAGGHSLIPVMKLRLGTPANLVDLGGIADLKGIRADGGDVVIGAMTTQFEIIHSDLLAAQLPILKETSQQIADPQVRYMGTIGGNAAKRRSLQRHAGRDDGAERELRPDGKGRDRVVPAREFYQGVYMTALQPGEMLSAIPHRAAAEGARLRLQQAEAEDRRLRDRRRRCDPDDGRRQGDERGCCAFQCRGHRAVRG